MEFAPELSKAVSSDLVALLGVFLVGLVVGMTVERRRAAWARRAWRERNSWRWQKPKPEYAKPPPLPPIEPKPVATKPPDAADQLRIVMSAQFSVQPILNKGEARVFKELDRMVLARNPGWQVMAQVSVGEILRCRDAEAYACINAKRVDLLLVDEDCRPRHVVEYQGAGHHQGTAAARDAVKKEALRRAGISYHEVIAGQTMPSELQRLVEKLVVAPVSSPAEEQRQNPSSEQAV
jgi:hypothetical protein